jgi:hypothetical protein
VQVPTERASPCPSPSEPGIMKAAEARNTVATDAILDNLFLASPPSERAWSRAGGRSWPQTLAHAYLHIGWPLAVYYQKGKHGAQHRPHASLPKHLHSLPLSAAHWLFASLPALLSAGSAPTNTTQRTLRAVKPSSGCLLASPSTRPPYLSSSPKLRGHSIVRPARRSTQSAQLACNPPRRACSHLPPYITSG